MITLIDRYGFVKQLNVVLPPGARVYHMACYRSPAPMFVAEANATFCSESPVEKRSFYQQGNTNVYEER